MAKVRNKSNQIDNIGGLAKAFLSLKTTGEFKKFMRDLCTLEEIEEMSKRWQAVKLIEAGVPYREVAGELGLSTTTVARVAHWLRHGGGGYKLILKRIGKQ